MRILNWSSVVSIGALTVIFESEPRDPAAGMMAHGSVAPVNELYVKHDLSLLASLFEGHDRNLANHLSAAWNSGV